MIGATLFFERGLLLRILQNLSWLADALSPRVEKRLCRFSKSKNYGVCVTPLCILVRVQTSRSTIIDTWYSINPFSDPGLNASSMTMIETRGSA